MNYEKLLLNNGVVRKGHFLLTSGLHSDTYIHKDAIFCNPYIFKQIVYKIAELAIQFKYDIVTGPAVAGAILAASMSILISKTFIYPEKIKISGVEHMCFRRGYDKIITNQKVLIIEDIITTGGSIVKTMNSIYTFGGEVAGIICIWNRTNWKPDNKIKIVSIINRQVDAWDPKKKECHLCLDNIPLTDPKE